MRDDQILSTALIKPSDVDMLILILILILVFGGGFGYHRYGYSRYGNRGYGLIGILVLILILYWLFGAAVWAGFIIPDSSPLLSAFSFIFLAQKPAYASEPDTKHDDLRKM